MNASECVACGCVLQYAILSPPFKAHEFQVQEGFPFSIALSWKGSAPESDSGSIESAQSTIAFPKGNPIPSIKALTFFRSCTFSVDVMYTDTGNLHVPSKFSTYTVISYFKVKTASNK